MSVKESCKFAAQKLGVCADKCEEFVKDLIPKTHCIPAARDAVAACKKLIEQCRAHIASCKNPTCTTVSQVCIKAAEKAVEKATACADACAGAGSDADCKIVCKDCAQACRACMQSCQDCLQKVCA